MYTSLSHQVEYDRASFEPVKQTSPSWSCHQGREEITQAAKGVAQPSKACQGYQEGHRRFSRQEEVNRLFYLFCICSEFEIGIVKLINNFFFNLDS